MAESAISGNADVRQGGTLFERNAFRQLAHRCRRNRNQVRLGAVTEHAETAAVNDYLLADLKPSPSLSTRPEASSPRMRGGFAAIGNLPIRTAPSSG